jgi:TrwC relaxase
VVISRGGARSPDAGAPLRMRLPAPRRVIERFSRRHAEILDLMGSRGETSARAARVATLETSRRKDCGVPIDRLHAEWRARAAEHGLDRVALRRVLRSRWSVDSPRPVWRSGSKGRTGSPGTARRSRGATCCRRSPSTRAAARPWSASSAAWTRSSRATGSNSSRWPANALQHARAAAARAHRARVRATARPAPPVTESALSTALARGPSRGTGHQQVA